MAVLFDRDKKELMITCRDGCDNGVSMKFADPWEKWDTLKGEQIFWMSYVNGNFYRDQHGAWSAIKEKAKKILAIIRNKDIYYSDILMTRDDFEQFREFVNSVELE